MYVKERLIQNHWGLTVTKVVFECFYDVEK